MKDFDRNQQWLDNWEEEADRLFRDLGRVPPNLEDELIALRRYQKESRQLSRELQAIRDKYAQKAAEKEATEQRLEEIARRLSREVEREMLERELKDWNARIRWLRAEVDRVTNKIIREMKRRKLRDQRLAEAEAEAAKAQAAKDVALWEAFKDQMAGHQQPEANLDTLEKTSDPERQEHLQREYAEFQSRMTATDAENQAMWDRFVRAMEEDDNPRIKKTKKKNTEPTQSASKRANYSPIPDPPPPPPPKRRTKPYKRRYLPEEDQTNQVENQATWDEFLTDMDQYLDNFDDFK